MKYKKSILLIGFWFFLFVSSCRTYLTSPESVGLFKDSLKVTTKKLHKYVDEGNLPGTFVRVIKNGKVVYDDRYGLIDIEREKPVEENSLFRIFSMTKPITAVAIMTLYDKGKLNLDDKVSDYIPVFAKTQVYKKLNGEHTTEPQKTPMTIRHLLTHTSGIPYGWEWSYVDSIYNARQHMRQDWTVEEMTKDIASIPLKFQPGTKYSYGLGIDVAGYIVELVSGMKLDSYLKKVIFDPLRMKDTRFYVPKEKSNLLSELYTYDENLKLKIMEDFDIKTKVGADNPPKLLLGGAGLISTMQDYENFCRMLLNKGVYKGKRVLSESATGILMTNQLPKKVSKKLNFGHGLSGTVNLYNGEYNWGGAASTSFWINPTINQIVICYTQLFGASTEYANEFKSGIDRALIDPN